MAEYNKYSNTAIFTEVDFNIPYRVDSIKQDSLAGTSDTLIDTISSKSQTIANEAAARDIQILKSRRDKKIYIGDSEYLQPITEIGFGLKEVTEQKGLQLPVRKINSYNTDWLTILLLVALVLLASVRFGFAKYISSLFQAVFNYSTSNRMFRERNYSILSGAFRLDVLYYTVISVFIIQVLAFFSIGTQRPGFLFYGKTLGVVILYFLLKKLIYKILGITFKNSPETSEFIFNIDNFNRVTGILLLPIVALLAFYPYRYLVVIVIAGAAAVLSLYLFLLGRGSSILLRKQFSILYLFLYLCTLEFLPLLLIFKVVAE